MTNKHQMNRLMGETIYYPTDHDDRNRFSQSRKNILKRQEDQLLTHLDYYNTQGRQK